MRKLLIVLITICVLAGLSAIVQGLCAARLYPSTMLVIDVIRDADYVVLATESGHTYVYKGASDEEVNDVMSVMMFDNFTPEVWDDSIVRVKYSGF